MPRNKQNFEFDHPNAPTTWTLHTAHLTNIQITAYEYGVWAVLTAIERAGYQSDKANKVRKHIEDPAEFLNKRLADALLNSEELRELIPKPHTPRE